jgi:hypothetical protein
MPHNSHYFTYSTLRYDIICHFSTRHEIFCLDDHLHGLLTIDFYDFNCRFICCKVSGAEVYAP